MKIVADWRDSWRWLSMHFMTLALAVQGAWLAVPGDLRSSVPAWAEYTVTAILLLLGVAGRLVDQQKKQ